MRRRLRFLFAWAVLAALPALSWAQITPAGGTAVGDDTQPPSARLGAVIFYDYTYQNLPKATDAAGNSISPTSLNVSRAYLNITGNISHIVSYRITPDISATRLSLSGTNTSTLDGSLVFRIKYAFAQFALDDWTGQWRASWVRMGVQQTPFVDWEEGIYRYRFQGTVFAERDGGMSSSDAGLSFHTNIPKQYGEVHVGIYNGENYNKGEANDQKGFMFRGTLRPLPNGSAFARGVRLTYFVVNDEYVKDADRNRTVFNVFLEQKKYTFGFDYLDRADQTLPTTAKTDADGYSFFLTPFFKEKGNGTEALVRYDSYRPNSTTNSDGRQNRLIAGVAYWFPHPGGAGTAALLLDYEQVTFKSIDSVKQRRVFLHGLINF